MAEIQKTKVNLFNILSSSKLMHKFFLPIDTF